MQIAPFRIEEYFGKYEFTAKYLLSSSDAESRTIADLLALETGAQDGLLKHWCGYTETPGAPWLRETITSLYRHIRAGDVLVVAAAEEAIFLFYHALSGRATTSLWKRPVTKAHSPWSKARERVSPLGSASRRMIGCTIWLDWKL